MEIQQEETQSVPFVTPELLVAACNAAGERIHCNEAWMSVFGNEELWGPLSTEDLRFAQEYINDAAKGSLVTHQVFLVDQSGRDIPSPVLLHFLPVFSDEPNPGKSTVLITGEVLQEPVTWAADQTRRRRMEMLGQMTMGIAHDFNNLLTTILGHVELLENSLYKESGTGSPAVDQLKTLEKAASDGATLVKKIQQYIRHEKQEHFEEVDLHTLAEEVLTLTRPYWYNEPRRQGISILVESNLDAVHPVLGSATELREVLVNLILNAVQAMPAGGTLRLSTHSGENKTVLLEVEDTGVGIPDRVRRRVFEPMYSTKGEQGSGMGLTVSYGIVQEHNGTIEIESQPGRGTCFRLTFPESTGPVEIESIPEKKHSGDRRKVNILVVDDEPMVRTVTAKLLRMKGHTITEAEGGREAMTLYQEMAFDLVITDLSMPEMSGRELAYQIRKQNAKQRILLLTGDTDAQDGSEAVDAVVGKPFKLNELEEIIQQLVARSH